MQVAAHLLLALLHKVVFKTNLKFDLNLEF